MRRVVNAFEKGVRAFGKGSSYLRKRGFTFILNI